MALHCVTVTTVTENGQACTLDICSSCHIGVGSTNQQRLVVGQPDRDPRGNPDSRGGALVARVEDVDEAAIVEAQLRARSRVGGGGVIWEDMKEDIYLFMVVQNKV